MTGEPEAAAGRGIARAAGLIALGNVASRALGLVRETVIADLFGAVGAVSAFRLANRIPTMIFDMLIGGMLSAALVPVFSEYVAGERQDELWHLFSIFLSLAAVILGGLVVVLELFAPQVAWLLAGGYDAELLAVMTRLIRIILPSILLFGLAGIVTGLLYALKCFSLPAFGAAVFNAGLVLTVLLLAGRLDIYSLSLGVVAGALLQLLIQLPDLRDVRVRFALDLRHPALRRILKLYLPVAAGLVISQIQVGIDGNLASRTGESSVAWMQNATTLIQFPHGLVAVAISLAVLPSLSQFSAAADWDGYRRTLALGLRLVVVLIVPATVGLFVLARPIVALLFEHGAFTAYDTGWTTLALRCYLLGLIFASVDWPLNYAFYARQDTLTPALVGVWSVAVYLVVALALLRPLGMIGLVLADSAKHAGHASVMLWLQWRRVGGLGGRGLVAVTLKAGLASAAMGAAALVTLGGVERVLGTGTLLSEAAAVLGAGGVGLAVYLALAGLLRVEEAKLLWDTARKRWRSTA